MAATQNDGIETGRLSQAGPLEKPLCQGLLRHVLEGLERADLDDLAGGFRLEHLLLLGERIDSLRAGTAGFWMTVIFIRPGTTNRPGPFLPTASLIKQPRPSSTQATCFFLSSAHSANPAMICDFVNAFAICTLLQKMVPKSAN